MRKAISLLLWLSLPSFVYALTITAGESRDTRVFPPYKKVDVPDLSNSVSDTVDYWGPYHIAGCGDGAVNPVWSAVLPAGVSIDPDTGRITGTLTTAETVSAELTCTNDSLGARYSLTDHFVWTVVGGGALPTQNTYFVSTSGTDSSCTTGGTGASPWPSLSVAQGCMAGKSAGSDLYLKSGDVFEDQDIDITWSGTAADRAIVGCYYEDAGLYYECIASNARPEINGTLDDSCRESFTCPTGRTGGGGVPSSATRGLVDIIGDYVTVKYLNLQDTAGIFYLMEGYYGIIDNIYAEYAYFQLGYHTGGNGKYAIVRNSYFASGNWHRTQWDAQNCSASPKPPGCTITFGNFRAGQGGIAIRNHRAGFADGSGANILIHGNVFADYSITGLNLEPRYDWNTELINCLQASRVIVADNVAYGVAPIYSDNCQYSLFERNLGMGTDTLGIGFLSVTLEEYPPNTSPATQGYDNDNVLYRNNVLFGVGHCIQFGDAEDGGLAAGFRNRNMHFYGNTCLASPDASFGFDNRGGDSLHGFDNFAPGSVVEYKSSLVFAPEAPGTGSWGSDPSCRALYSAIDVDYVMYDDTTPPGKSGLAALCTSANTSTTSDPMLATPYANKSTFSPFGTALTMDAAEPQAGSPLVGAGDPALDTEELSWVDSTVFDSYIVDYYLDYMSTLGDGCNTAGNWKKKLACDGRGNTRDATTPDIGAVERQ